MMKLSVAVVILFGATLATAQNKSPILAGSHPNRHPARSDKSISSGAVAAVLNRKSTTASDLAKIERGPVIPSKASKPATRNTSASKAFGVGQDNRNKPIHASKPGTAGHSSFHPKTKTR